MAARKPKTGKKYFTPALANATLPLVRAIVKDITTLAHSLRERHQRLARLSSSSRGLSEAHQEELTQMQTEFERDQTKMHDYEQELTHLGIEMKDYYTGLIDFPCWMDGREVFLCWRLGEHEVAHWHEVDAGFAGRQKLMVDAEME
jgi:hypothetical protein